MRTSNHYGTHSAARLQLVRWTARIGAVTADALAQREGEGLNSARGRLLAAERSGLLAASRPLRDAPALFVATAAGVRAAGLLGIEPTRVSPANARHASACAAVAAVLEGAYEDHVLSGERELRRDERAYGAPLASARMPGRAGEPEMHRPDLVLWPLARWRLPVAVEVELTVKAPRRLSEICTAWARCRCVSGVLYVASSEAHRPLARALEQAQAGERIALVGLGQLLGEHAPGAGALERPIAGGA